MQLGNFYLIKEQRPGTDEPTKDIYYWDENKNMKNTENRREFSQEFEIEDPDFQVLPTESYTKTEWFAILTMLIDDKQPKFPDPSIIQKILTENGITNAHIRANILKSFCELYFY